MDALIFRCFVETAMGLQADQDTPGDYTMVKAAAEAKYGIMTASGARFTKFSESRTGFRDVSWNNGGLLGGMAKKAWNTGELAGLGILAAPSASNLAGHPWGEKSKDVSEVTGLGLLAAPYAHNIATGRSARYANSGIGRGLAKAFSH